MAAHVFATLEPGGAQLGAARLMRAHRALGIRSFLLAGEASAEGVALMRREGIDVEVWSRPWLGLQYSCSRAWAQWLAPRLAGSDLVHAHMFGGWWAAAAAAGPTLPLVASEHNAVRWPARPRLAPMRRALERVDRFFAHGPAARELVLSLGLPPSRLREGVSPVPQGPCRAARGLPPRRLVYAGRLHHEKGPDLLLHALARMRRPPATLLLGSGPMERELRDLARRLGLGRVARFCGWQDDPAPFVAGSRACVVPSRHEAFSQTAVMAMGLGVPVVGTAVEGLPAVLADGRGLLVAPEDPAALARAIEALLAGRVTTDTPAARAYARRFSVQRVAAAYAADYAELRARARAVA